MTNVLRSLGESQKVRRERKYIVTLGELTAFHDRVKLVLQADSHDKDSVGYYNHSIYFDSPGYDHYVDKREGLSIRSKPRLRTYRKTIDGAPMAYFLEFKNRLNDVNWKERQQLDAKTAVSLVLGSNRFDPGVADTGNLLAKFHLHDRLFALSPAATVLYHRKAFTCLLDPSLRITFDSRVMGAPAGRQEGGPDGYHFVLPPTLAVLEIKYDFGFPEWLLRIVMDLELDLVSVSKYGLALEGIFARIRNAVDAAS
jgi:hypothetical protein